MKRLLLLLIPMSVLALSGCVVVPAHGYGYYRAGAVVAVPPPAVTVRAYAY
ncbi:MAG: hypothetical protein ABSE43_00840 [Steroidobacteraceae bacterium]|jgi:hypothetical protein